jgi:hypothetical protein
MTEDRLRHITFEMEDPPVRLRGVQETLWRLVQASKGEPEAAIFALLARNLERELADIRKMWCEFFVPAVERGEPPLKAVGE